MARLSKSCSDIVFNCEDQDPRRFGFDLPPHKIHNVIILRDPFNNVASGIKHERANADSVMWLWNLYVNEFLEITNFLGDKIPISFNGWFSSEEYRKSISDKIGGEPEDRVRGTLPKAGGGSSFDKFRFQNKAQEMDVLNRWQMLLNLDLDFPRIFNSEVITKCRLIFGDDFVDPIVHELKL